MCGRLLLPAMAVGLVVRGLAAQSPASPPSSAVDDARTRSGVTVSGRVVNLYPEVPPTPPREVLLSAGDRYVGSFGPPSRTVIRPDGTFEFTDVTPGHYRLFVNPGGSDLMAEIEVLDRDRRDVEVPTAVQLPVTIRATMDDGSPLPAPPAARIQVHRTTGRRPQTGSVATVGLDGTLRTSVVPGPTYFFLRPPSGFHVKSLRSGRVDLVREPLNPGPDSPPIEVAAVISRTPPTDVPTVKVSGRVTGDHPGTELRLADVRDIFSTRRSLMRTTTRPDGTFEFLGVPPGPYTLDIYPARDVLRGIIAVGKDVEGLEVVVPPGVILGGLLRGVYDSAGRGVPMSPGRVPLRFSDGSVSHIVLVGGRFFWTALPAGSYRVDIVELPRGFSVRSLTAGSANLMTHPFVVPATRPPEQIEIALQFN